MITRFVRNRLNRLCLLKVSRVPKLTFIACIFIVSLPTRKLFENIRLRTFFFFFLLLPNQYYFLHLYIACIPGEVNVYVNQVYYRCYRLEKAGSIT